MRNHLLTLVKGELQRLNKYHVTLVSFIVAVMWFLMLFFIKDLSLLVQMLPIVILIDVTMMTITYVGAVMFFEKTEKAISTLLVTPIKKSELILSKVIAISIAQSISTLLIIIVFFIVKDIKVYWHFAFIVLIASTVFHGLLGFVFSYFSKDFTSMLVNLMTYMFIFTIPSVLYQFEIIFKGEIIKYVLLISPTQSVMQLVEPVFNNTIGLPYIFSLIYMVLGSYLGYRYYVLPKYKDYAIKESGV